MPYKLSLNKFFVDEIYQRYLINPSIVFSKAIAFFDWEIYDKYVVNGLAKITEKFSRFVGIRLDYNLLDQKIVGIPWAFYKHRFRWWDQKPRETQF